MNLGATYKSFLFFAWGGRESIIFQTYSELSIPDKSLQSGKKYRYRSRIDLRYSWSICHIKVIYVPTTMMREIKMTANWIIFVFFHIAESNIIYQCVCVRLKNVAYPKNVFCGNLILSANHIAGKCPPVTLRKKKWKVV